MGAGGGSVDPLSAAVEAADLDSCCCCGFACLSFFPILTVRQFFFLVTDLDQHEIAKRFLSPCQTEILHLCIDGRSYDLD